MKNVLFPAFFILCAAGLSAQQVAHSTPELQTSKQEVLAFKALEHDFGKIPQGKPVYYGFEVTNISDSPVKIEQVTASCGCTTPEWSKDEIPVGGTSRIRVGYNSAAEGPFEKLISVAYNGNSTKQIKIKGAVWKAPAGSAPVNPSVQFLKQQIQ